MHLMLVVIFLAANVSLTSCARHVQLLGGPLSWHCHSQLNCKHLMLAWHLAKRLVTVPVCGAHAPQRSVGTIDDSKSQEATTIIDCTGAPPATQLTDSLCCRAVAFP